MQLTWQKFTKSLLLGGMSRRYICFLATIWISGFLKNCFYFCTWTISLFLVTTFAKHILFLFREISSKWTPTRIKLVTLHFHQVVFRQHFMGLCKNKNSSFSIVFNDCFPFAPAPLSLVSEQLSECSKFWAIRAKWLLMHKDFWGFC